MEPLTIHKTRSFSGRPAIPGDKSISHRALLFGALSEGTTRVSGLLASADVQSTRVCLEQLGVRIRDLGSGEVEIEGRGLYGFQAPSAELDCGNSGTTMRLLMGVLAAQPFDSVLTGDASLRKRPMARVANPLREMGASIELAPSDRAPVRIAAAGRGLIPLKYELPIASAQIKSALLLASLFVDGESMLRGKIHSRDHTERMLPHFGVPVEVTGGAISVRGGIPLRATSVRVPGDFSTASFWLAAAAIVPGALIEMKGISLNPTRLGFLKVLRRMGASIETEIMEQSPEPWGTLRIRQAPLRATQVLASEVPELIDELPILAVLATQAEGVTEVRGAEELRVKESDRLEALARALRSMGAEMTLYEDGFAITGPQKLRGAKIITESDHRIAMAFSIAGLVADGATKIDDPSCVAVSYPGFFRTLRELCHE